MPTDPQATAATEHAEWHTLSVAETTAAQGVDSASGLSAAAVADRRQLHGPNLLAEPKRVPTWRKIVHLLTEKMTIVLLVAAIVSAVVSRELETPIVKLAVIILNTIQNYVQEPRAETSLQALQKL
ncbi:MAG: hypothetical protein LH624_06505, partial [Cryobacterium sp.]|nr:hypothetical protein [Cryobacterium sp.]